MHHRPDHVEPLEVATAQIRLGLSVFCEMSSSQTIRSCLPSGFCLGHRETVRMLEAWMTSLEPCLNQSAIGLHYNRFACIRQETYPPDWPAVRRAIL